MKKYFSSYFQRKSSGEQAEDIHNIARDYFGGDFANPKRGGCPSPESFNKLIGEKGLPDERLRNHMFGCSECFNEYRMLLRQASSAEVLKKNASAFRFNTALAGGLAAILIALGGGLFWFWKTDSNSSQTARSDNLEARQNFNANVAGENAETNSISAVENQPASAKNNINAKRQINPPVANKSERRSTVKKAETLLAKNEVEIGLNNPVWRDSASGGNQKIVRLEARKTRFRLKLPKENPKGVYQIFLADEFGKTLTEKKNVPAKNQTLSVEFDLRKFSGSQKRLCFAPVGEIPDCVPVDIAAPE